MMAMPSQLHATIAVRMGDDPDGETDVLVKKVIVLAGLAVIATACSTSGNDGAGAASPANSSIAPVDTSTAPVSTTTPASTAPASSGPASSAVAATSSPVPQPTSSPTATLSPCETIAATRKFLYLTAATQNADGSLTVTGNVATMVCGGPDDFHFNFGTVKVTGHVLATASLEVIGTSQNATPITLAKFPAYLATDHQTRVFIVTGSAAGITGLTEQFHP
jgi:hypothetical protein